MQLEDLQITKDIDAELADEEFSTATHGTAYCYGKGCKGPICKKGNRDRRRKTRNATPVPGPADDIIEQRLLQYLKLRDIEREQFRLKGM